MNNTYETTIESCSRADSIVWLRLQAGRLAATIWPEARKGNKVSIRIAAKDVILCEHHPGRSSARNVLPGHVKSLRRMPDGVLVTIDVGFPLVAKVTRAAASDLGLKRGTTVFALIKASAIGPVVATAAPIRVSIAGKKGLITPKQIDFLRAIASQGSLSKAASTLGMTYRSAWNWAQAINTTWGAPVIKKIGGGRGAGGSGLTLEGRAIVERAEKIES